VSACLAGQRVRYDGGHKREAFVVGTLARLVELVPVCPEVEVGMGTPRPPVHLIRIGSGVRMIDPASGADHTRAMTRFAARRLAALARERLDGYVLKADSPSCGPEDVPIHSAGSGPPRRDGRGLFAAALLARWPGLPVEDERGLGEPARRVHFLTRVFAHHRIRRFFAGRWSIGALVAFHACERVLIAGHDAAACRALDRLVARAKTVARAELAKRYRNLYARAWASRATGRDAEGDFVLPDETRRRASRS
jgi:uncharacterized protein YbbK (DUF523 family)